MLLSGITATAVKSGSGLVTNTLIMATKSLYIGLEKSHRQDHSNELPSKTLGYAINII